MATHTSGGVSKATAPTVAAMLRSAESRRCPACNRKSALKTHHGIELGNGPQTVTACRWCDYERWVDLETGQPCERYPRTNSAPTG